MPISAPPTIPQITDPSTFATRAQDWVVWQANEFYPGITDIAGLSGLPSSATSATSNTIGTGSKSFTVETGRGFIAGQSLSIANTTTPTNRMFAVVTSYNSGTGALVVDVQDTEGAGTFTAWSISLSYFGRPLGNRNKIINGNMGIYQRGTAAVTTSGYGPADRWTTNATGNTFSTTQGSFVSGDTLFDTGGAQYFSQIAVTSVAGAGSFTIFKQPIEDVRLLAGQTVTVSFWAKANAGTPLIGVELETVFGTGGSGSVNGVGQAQALTTTWTKYSKTFTVPSIAGKTIGTEATHYTNLNFWLDSGSTYDTRSGSIGQSSKTVSIAQVQLEVGSIATPFEFRPYGTELALCQRYGEPCPEIEFSGYGLAGNQFGYPIFKFNTQKRTAPTASTAVSYTLSNATLSSTTTSDSVVRVQVGVTATGAFSFTKSNTPFFSAEL